MAARPRSGSRLSQLLRQGEQNASGPDRSDMEELHASGKSPYSTLRSRVDASPSRNSVASSLSQQKTPARSYFHRSSVRSHPGQWVLPTLP